MEFDKDNKVKHETLNFLEAQAFKQFLEAELIRHFENQQRAVALSLFYHSEGLRDQDDIDGITKTIKFLQDKFKI